LKWSPSAPLSRQRCPLSALYCSFTSTRRSNYHVSEDDYTVKRWTCGGVTGTCLCRVGEREKQTYYFVIIVKMEMYGINQIDRKDKRKETRHWSSLLQHGVPASLRRKKEAPDKVERK
jgi:hypothetical protein